MAYADYDFYSNTFHGDVLSPDDADRWLDRAGDEVDRLTFNRLSFAFPTVEIHVVKVKKAVCSIAEALYLIDVQRKAAAAQKAENGTYRGAVTSISSGRESVSYSAGNTSASVYAAAAASDDEQIRLICSLASAYLANVPDAQGVNLLYSGR